jgi:hypothetical protein
VSPRWHLSIKGRKDPTPHQGRKGDCGGTCQCMLCVKLGYPNSIYIYIAIYNYIYIYTSICNDTSIIYIYDL